MVPPLALAENPNLHHDCGAIKASCASGAAGLTSSGARPQGVRDGWPNSPVADVARSMSGGPNWTARRRCGRRWRGLAGLREQGPSVPATARDGGGRNAARALPRHRAERTAPGFLMNPPARGSGASRTGGSPGTGQPFDAPGGPGHDPVAVWKEFCAEARIQHDGRMQPPVKQEELW